jgi:hypothetical protein
MDLSTRSQALSPERAETPPMFRSRDRRAIRLLDQRGAVTRFGDIVETGPTTADNNKKLKGILVAGARNHHYLQLWRLVA